MDMFIRKAIEKDLESICHLLGQVQGVHSQGRPDIFKDGASKYDRESVLGILKNPNTPVYVATDSDDCVVGYVFCIIELQNETSNLKAMKNFYVDDLCIDEKMRGKGVGTKLYKYVEEVAKTLGCYHLTLNVWHLNESALRFYQRLGMTPLKTTMEKILK